MSAKKTNNVGNNANSTSRKGKVNKNSKRGQDVKSKSPGEYVLLHEALMHNGQLSGYKFQRAARVKLPNGTTHLLPLDEFITIDLINAWDILPYILRVLDSENKKCSEFVSTNLQVSQHSAESKLKRYLANCPEEISVALSDQLEGSIIETKVVKTSKES